jgi:hypothetical protein
VDEGSTQRTVGIVTGAVGVTAAAVGLGFGLAASSKWNEAQTACPANKCRHSVDLQLGKDAGTAADVSSVLVGVGAVGIAAGVVIWLLAPKGDTKNEKGRSAMRVLPEATTTSVGLSLGGAL